MDAEEWDAPPGMSSTATVFNVTEAEFRAWPPEQRRRYIALAERRAALLGIDPPPKPWPAGGPVEAVSRYLPHFATADPAPHHVEFWDHLESTVPGNAPADLVLCINRGGAKTTLAEMATVLLGAHRRRRMILYVRATQSKANEAITDIADMMGSPQLVRDFPEMARRRLEHRKLNVFTMQRIQTQGLLVFGIGLDAASRGLKFGKQRPDCIILDDVDSLGESQSQTRRKLEILSHTIIPTGTPGDTLVIFVENLMGPQTICSRLVYPERFPEDERFLLGRKVIGPIPAVYGLDVAQVPSENDTSQRVWKITAGRPSWEGFSLAAAEDALNQTNLPAFLAEYQHENQSPEGNVFTHIDFAECDVAEIPWADFIDRQVWVDPSVSDNDGSDSMGICAAGVTTAGVVYMLWAWEAVTSPSDALKRAIEKAYDLGCSTVGVETDNGGKAWESVFREALQDLQLEGRVPQDWTPRYDFDKAGYSGKSKHERFEQLVGPYEQRRIVLVRGTTMRLRAALTRYNRRKSSKPWDVLDASWYCHKNLSEAPHRRGRARTAARQARPRYTPRQRA